MALEDEGHDAMYGGLITGCTLPCACRYVDAALHLADLQAKGVIRNIGATNFDVPRLAAITDAGVPIAAHQVRAAPASGCG